MRLPEKGPWGHAYYEIADAYVDVRFTEEEGRERVVRIRHKVVGEGPPLVLIHGLMTSSYSWRYVLAPLAKHYRIFAPDLLGSGASDKPLDHRYSVANQARFVAAYVRTVAEMPVYLVGNSLGGLYGLAALLDDASIARRFVMMHSPGYPLTRTRLSSALFRTPLLGAGARSLVARVAHRYPERFIAKNVHYARKDMMSREEAIEYGRIFDTVPHARVFAKILDESLSAKEHADVIARLRRGPPKLPVLLLWARHDVMVPPAFGPKYHADLPGSKLVWFEDASHFMHVDAPEAVVKELVSFDADA